MIWFIILFLVILAGLPDILFGMEQEKKKEQQRIDTKRYQNLHKTWRM